MPLPARTPPGSGQDQDNGASTTPTLLYFTTIDLGLQNGPSAHVAGVTSGLARRGWKVAIVSPTPSAPLAVPPAQGVEHHHFANLERWRLPRAAGAMLAVRWLWRRRDAGAVYVRSSPGTMPITAMAATLRFPVIAVEHNGWLAADLSAFGYGARLAGPVRWLQAHEARCATVNRAVTTEIAALLSGAGVDPDRIEVIGNGVDLTAFRPLPRKDCRRRLGLEADGPPVLVYLGNLWPGCGLDTVIEAMRLSAAKARPLRLLVGGDGIEAASLAARARAIPQHESYVRFLGALPPEQANVALGASDLAVAPYQGPRNAVVGNSALKLRTYAAAGRPCVASGDVRLDDGPQPWLVEVPAGSPGALLDGIERLLASDRSALEWEARAFAERRLGWERVAERVDAILSARKSRA